MKRIVISIVLAGVAAGFSGCGPLFKVRKAMYDQEKFEPLERTDFFGDNRSSRELIEGTIPRGWLRADTHLYEGKVNGSVVDRFPFEITAADLERGRERFNIYCALCHGRAGYGDGMIVQRGFKQPPSYHGKVFADKQHTVGSMYGIVANGFGVMSGYADQIPVEDRWRIVAYVKALQFSQNADLQDVPEDMRATLLAEEK